MTRTTTLALICLCIFSLTACELPCSDRPGGCCDGDDACDEEKTPPPAVQPTSQCVRTVDCIPAQPSAGVIYNCVNGTCHETQRPCNAGYDLNVLGQCVKVQTECVPYDDGNPCTTDSCDPANGAAVNVPKTCDDGNPLTTDSCEPTTGDCSHIFDCGNCADEDPCTTDTCDPTVGCQHEPIVCGTGLACQMGTCVIRCASDEDCADDDMCTIDACELASGKCRHEQRDCSDADQTTLDRCVSDRWGFHCESIPTACTGGCDDGNACTTDSCQGGICAHLALACGAGTVCSPLSGECIPAPCAGTADCDDGNPCTSESCEFGVCRYIDRICDAGAACNAADGTCVVVEHPDCSGGCDDGDAATLDYCEGGTCQYVQPVSCGAGTALNPETGECAVAVADPTCVAGTRSCQQFEATQTLAYAFCAGGVQYVVESCGSIGEAVCLDGSGCARP